MKKLRYIDTRPTSGWMVSAIMELYDILGEIEGPVLVAASPVQDGLFALGGSDWGEAVYLNRIPAGMPQHRLKLHTAKYWEGEIHSAWLALAGTTVRHTLYLPGSNLSARKAFRLMAAVTRRVLRTMGINEGVTYGGNDMYLHGKKFCGMGHHKYDAGVYLATALQFEFPRDGVRDMLKHGELISDVSGGLLEEYPDLDIEQYMDTMATFIAGRIGADLVKSNWSQKEMDAISACEPVLSSAAWIQEARRE